MCSLQIAAVHNQNLDLFLQGAVSTETQDHPYSFLCRIIFVLPFVKTFCLFMLCSKTRKIFTSFWNILGVLFSAMQLENFAHNYV